jgi:hypothetical protein
LNVLEIGAGGIEYNGTNVSFEKIAAIQAVTSATNSTTLNLNNSLTIQNGETSLPPTTSMTLSSASGNLTMLLTDGGVSSYGTAGQVLTSGGSGGSLTWAAGGGGSQNLNQVLTQGNTTTLSAIFNSATPSTPTTTIVNTGVAIAVGPAVNTITQTGMSVIAGLEQSAYEADGMEYTLSSAGLPVGKTIIDDKVTIQTIAGGLVTTSNTIEAGLTTMLNGTNTLTTSATTLVIADTSSAPAIITNTVEDNKLTITNTTGIQKTILLDNSTASPYIGLLNNDNSPTLLQAIFDMDSLLFYTGTNPLALSAIGMERSGTGLQLTTNGTLSFNGLGGSAGNILTYSSGNAVWSPPPTIVNGRILNPTYNATTPTFYSFPTAFTGAIPNVVLTFDNGSATSPTIIIVGLATVTLSGFYYLLSATAPVGSNLNWFATQ